MTNNIEIETEIRKLMNEDYKAFVKALCNIEGISLSDKNYEDWLKNDFPLVHESLQNLF